MLVYFKQPEEHYVLPLHIGFNMTDIEIGLYLQKRRVELKLKLTDIAEFSKMDLGSLSKFEKGQRPLPKHALPNISTTYKIPFFTLVSMVYDEKIPKLEKENLLPHMKRIAESGLENFSFTDLSELLDTEQRLGFTMEKQQLKAWYDKRFQIK